MMIQTCTASATDIVEIIWCLADGTIYVERHTLPPHPVIEAVRTKIAKIQADVAAGRLPPDPEWR